MRASLLAAAISVACPALARAQCSTANQKLIAEQKFEEARADVRGLLRSNPNDDAALHCMGIIGMSDDKPGEAVEWFEKAIKVNEKSSVHHLWLGNALGEQADHTSKFKLPFLARRVKGEFDRAVELDPSSVDARHGLIQFYSQAPGVMGGSMDKAKEQAREIGKLNPWRGHYEMAQLLERDKDAAGAEREYTAAVGAAADSNATYLYLGSFLRRQKRYDEAVAIYDNLLKRRPDANNAHLNIAFTLNQANKDPERVDRETRLWMANAPADAPKANSSIAHFLLGQSAEKQSRKDAAKVEYQQALTLNPKNNEAKKALDGLRG